MQTAPPLSGTGVNEPVSSAPSTSQVNPDMSAGPPVTGTAPTTGPDGSSAPTDAVPSSSAPQMPAVIPEMIDDFEDTDGALLGTDGRAGHWGTYNDGTGQQTPAAGTGITPEAGGANGSAYAVHTLGSGFSDWGAGLQVDLKNTGSGAASRQPYDAGAHGGVSFYVRGSGSLRVEFVTRAVTPTSEGGTCAAECLDAHAAPLTLNAEWQLVTLLFSELEQEGWGTAADFSAADLLSLNFKATKGTAETADFDFWLDELRFVAPGATSTTPEPEPEPEENLEPLSEPGMCGGDLGTYNGNGSVTMYWFAQGSAEVNCSYSILSRDPDSVAHVHTGEGRYFGAMNTTDYNASAMCGACAEVTRDGSRTVTVTIVDQCPVATNPKCTRGHIDLSRDAFHQLGQDNEGHLGTGNGGTVGSISWKYVPCPVQGNVLFKWKKGAAEDQYWDELLIQNHPYAISSVEIDGQPATRKEYNYWEPPEGTIAPAKDHYRVRVTDINGAVIEASVERLTGDLDTGVALSCQ